MKFLLSLIIIGCAWYGLQFVPRPDRSAGTIPSEYASVNQQLTQLIAESQTARESNATSMNALTSELGIESGEKMVTYEVISPMHKVTERMSASAEQTGASVTNAVSGIQLIIDKTLILLQKLNKSVSSSIGLFTFYLIALRLLKLWPALRVAASSGVWVGKTVLIALAVASIGTQWFYHTNLWAMLGLVYLSMELFIAGMVGLILLDMNYPWRKTLIATAIFPCLSLIAATFLS